MLMKDNKKNMATMIIGSMKKDQPEMPEENVEQDDNIAKESAAQDLLSAIEQKSASGIVAAFQNLMELCEYSEEPAEEAAE